jgi:hypothetical protein
MVRIGGDIDGIELGSGDRISRDNETTAHVFARGDKPDLDNLDDGDVVVIK